LFNIPPFCKGGQGDLTIPQKKTLLHYNQKLKASSRHLRKNMTEAEKLLWSKVRLKQLKDCQFYRQKTIGNYIVDFYCPQARIVVEIDGGQYYTQSGIGRDKIRDAFLIEQKLKVLRFSDREVLKNPDGVVQRIFESL
jgi:very-short-patch-repair endonuclease